MGTAAVTATISVAVSSRPAFALALCFERIETKADAGPKMPSSIFMSDSVGNFDVNGIRCAPSMPRALEGGAFRHDLTCGGDHWMLDLTAIDMNLLNARSVGETQQFTYRRADSAACRRKD